MKLVFRRISHEGWVSNCLYHSSKHFGNSKADSHGEMTSNVLKTKYGNMVRGAYYHKKVRSCFWIMLYSTLKYRIFNISTT